MNKKHRFARYFILFLMLFVACGQTVFAQNNLLRTVSIDIQQQRLADALDILSKKGGFYFSYSSNIIPKDSLVTLSVANSSVKEVLDTLLQGNFDYKEAPNYVILRPAPYRLSLIPENITEKDQVYTISGYVRDDRTGASISEASVYEKRLLLSTLTDDEGAFKLKIKSRDSTIALTVTKELYQEVTVVILSSVTVNSSGRKGRYGYDPDDHSGRVERTAFGRFLVSSKQKIQSLNLRGFFARSPFQTSLTPGLSSHGMLSSQVINKFSLNLLGGYTAGVNGVEWAGVFNINKKNVRYLQAAGIFNIVGGSVGGVQLAGVNNTVLDSVNGVQTAGVYNLVANDFIGVQAGGVLNIVGGSVHGVQLAGVYNSAKDQVNGVQMAGAFNYTENSVKGVTVAGLGNFNRQKVNGLQIAGALNIAHNTIRGVQLAGALNKSNANLTGVQIGGAGNISRGETRGIQLSGLFNYAKKLKGLQLGVINFADSSSGVSVGVLNFIRGGYRKVSISANEVLNTNIAFKTGNAKLYSILMGGMNISDSAKAYAFGFGLGHDFILNKNLSVSAELSSQTLYLGNWDKTHSLQRAKMSLNVNLLKGITVFAGPAFNLHTDQQSAPGKGYKQSFPAENYPVIVNNRDVKGWLGWEAGITLF